MRTDPGLPERAASTGPALSAVSVALVRCADAERFVSAADKPLTEWEVARAAAIAHPRRRAEWLAGRLATKWLVLEHALAGVTDTAIVWPPRVSHVGGSELEAHAHWRYQRIEVRRGTDGEPLLAWDGLATATRCVSIAHCGGWAVAALSTGGSVGVDLEAIAPRAARFYESNMSDGERRWMSDAAATDADRMGTLLWVLKEAVLKTGAARARTIWEIGAIELGVDTRASEIASTWPRHYVAPGGRLSTLPLRVHLAEPSSSANAAYGLVGRDLVIGVVAVTPSDVAQHARRAITAWQ